MDTEANTQNDEQVIWTARSHARDIMARAVSPYEGGRRIWRECQLRLTTGDHRLDPFVYWAGEYEEATDEARRALCNKAIREAAAFLLGSGSAL